MGRIFGSAEHRLLPTTSERKYVDSALAKGKYCFEAH